MRIAKVVAVVALAVGALGAGGLFLLDRYVQSPGFRDAVLGAARQALGADVQIGALRVSVFRGATLERVAIRNPGDVPGDLLTADTLTVRYRLWPLLWRRLEVDQASLDRPVLRLVRSESGLWNYERVGPRPPGGASVPPPAGPPPPSGPGTLHAPFGLAGGLDVILPKLGVTRGQVTVVGESGRRLVEMEGLELDTGLRLAGQTLTGSGSTRIETLSVGDALVVRHLAAPVRFSGSELTLSPLRGELAGGKLQGEVAVRLGPQPRYTTRLEVADADVERLVTEAGAARRLARGRLRAQARIEGAGGLSTLTGQGRAEVQDGALLDLPALQLLGAMLQVPALRDLRFRECRVEFTLAGGEMQTPVIRVVAPDLQITGQGVVALASGTLDHRLTLAIARQLHARAPREVRDAFTERPDGMLALDFRVWGRYDAPRTDLSSRLFRGGAEGFLGRGLRQLFRK